MGANISFRDFGVFCPKAIAGIGKLPDTAADRSAPIRMERRAADEKVERFRRRRFEAEAATIRDSLAEWLAPNLQILKEARPDLPCSLSARQQDGCEPLLAIADLAGGDWPERARVALIQIFRGEAAQDASVGVRLLTDIQTVFSQQSVDRIFTADLLAALCDLDPQWLEFTYGKPLSPAALARLLRGYEVLPRKIRIEERTASGYFRDSFSDAWARYVPHKLEQMEQRNDDAGETSLPEAEQTSGVPVLGIAESPMDMRCAPFVPVPNRGMGRPGRTCYIHRDKAAWHESPLGSGNWICSRCHPHLSVLSAKELGFS